MFGINGKWLSMSLQNYVSGVLTNNIVLYEDKSLLFYYYLQWDLLDHYTNFVYIRWKWNKEIAKSDTWLLFLSSLIWLHIDMYHQLWPWQGYKLIHIENWCERMSQWIVNFLSTMWMNSILYMYFKSKNIVSYWIEGYDSF